MDRHYWKHELTDKLTDGFIRYQWNLENPFPTGVDLANLSQPPWVTQYLNDALFHARVCHLVAGVMNIIIPEIETLLDKRGE